MKSFAALVRAAFIAGAGLLWVLSNPVVIVVKVQPVKPSAEIPTFHRVTEGGLERRPDVTGDRAHDALSEAALTAANNLKSDPCNPILKARYIEAANKYARAWLSIPPCAAQQTAAARGDSARLNQAQKTFDSALDERAREAMQKAHETDIFVVGDFARDVAQQVAVFARDGVINPYASTKGKEIAGSSASRHNAARLR